MKTKVLNLIAHLRASVAILLDRVNEAIGRIRAAADATDRALAKIDKGVRALEAARAKTEANYEAAQANVEIVIGAFHESYAAASNKRAAAAAKAGRAEALYRKYAD